MSSAGQHLEQQRRAFRLLIILDWVGIAVSVPLAFVVAVIFSPASETLGASIGFGVIALLGSGGWAFLFYRRVNAHGITFNERLKRLGQAAITGAYPAYLGVAVVAVTGTITAALPFIAVAAVNVTAIKRLGDRLLGANET